MSPKLIEVPLDPIPDGRIQRLSSDHPSIKEDQQYLVKIYGRWYAGYFTKQWYGWSFSDWGTSGIQLDSIQGPVYEIKD